ncbi:MAG TPA: monovalent cation/H+ antiporter complex subunit F [Actinomycetota bacterium]|nr:monovalent cation/H+ antiporter complex subunit F [Actinomycetota bacterium]
MIAVDVGLVALGVSFLAGVTRAAIGPSTADRAVAADLCLFSVVGALALLAVRLDAVAFLDTVLVATIVGFIATVSLAYLIERRIK